MQLSCIITFLLAACAIAAPIGRPVYKRGGFDIVLNQRDEPAPIALLETRKNDDLDSCKNPHPLTEENKFGSCTIEKRGRYSKSFGQRSVTKEVVKRNAFRSREDNMKRDALAKQANNKKRDALAKQASKKKRESVDIGNPFNTPETMKRNARANVMKSFARGSEVDRSVHRRDASRRSVKDFRALKRSNMNGHFVV
ncbi:hypothetical protein CB0940_11531 [Cercospora beticola]|uniref:Uncharacterized protein n=1 Tax=Cercospora beticola TaxID=122368 RepID=A0A2G5HEC8_CERBT|nr:hypothetical protein CB0940_11531 [Cercospora beticola]PIA90911.1 hypothetical protein CB0940_11531 [Cercospora beticola]WPB08400.1 hypothetical protein RHO25_013066 [Cercospora beticola]CAK1367703.1 unnamed protein product [Cercospora beticola]